MGNTPGYKLLNDTLGKVIGKLAQGIQASVPPNRRAYADEIIKRSEAAKGVLTVTLTSLVYKILLPEQDIRRHQTSIPGGYSGRTFDTANITPFLRENGFPAMAESGWLTRSLEQKVPYDRDYTGSIRPQSLKDAFLNIINDIQESSSDQRICLLEYILGELVRQRESQQVSLATPQSLSINQVILLLEKHFSSTYRFPGASRLPTLALYAVYQVLVKELKRFDGCSLCELESHTSADKQSGRMGDIDVLGVDCTPFEAVEVKYNIPISSGMVSVAYEKFKSTHIKRYYILSTAETAPSEKESIERRIQDIRNIHGCQVIVNGIYTTLKYYLRLINDPALFVKQYTDLLGMDEAVKFEHREAWNSFVIELCK